jgi:hypothetical protein
VKILFLDFDGVISTNRAYLANGVTGFLHRDERWIDPIAVAMIADLCTKYNYQIVVTSTWRKFGKARCTTALGRANIWMHDDWCTKDLWATADSKGSRPMEIDDWLGRHLECENFLILDDDGFDWTPEQADRWIRTDTLNGFSTENYEEVMNRNET